MSKIRLAAILLLLAVSLPVEAVTLEEDRGLSRDMLLYKHIQDADGRKMAAVIRIEAVSDSGSHNQIVNTVNHLFLAEMEKHGWHDYYRLWLSEKGSFHPDSKLMHRHRYLQFMKHRPVDIRLAVDDRPVFKIFNLMRSEGDFESSYKFRGNIHSTSELEEFIAEKIQSKIIPSIMHKIALF